MPKKKKSKLKKAPENYYDMKDSVEKDKKVKMSEVFGTKGGKKVPKGSHKMPDGSVMKDSKMKKKKSKKKSSY